MGVEKLFRTLKKVSDTAIKVADEKNDIDYFYIDFNSIIYNVFGQVEYELNSILYSIIYDDNNYEKIKSKWLKTLNIDKIDLLFFENIEEDKMDSIVITKIREYINYVITRFINSENLKKIYIYADGIPSFAKMIEQKKRRYIGYIENKIKAKLIEKLGDRSYENIEGKINYERKEYEYYKVELSRGKIIPYSKFMTNLLENLKKLDKVEISGVDKFGEGERKIIWNIIREKQVGNFMVHSPDGDVMLLCMLLNNSKRLFKIMRVEFRDIVMNYDIINCDELNTFIYNYVNEKIRVDETKKINIINDIILLYTFFGNDFLPKIESLDISNNYLTIPEIYGNYLIFNPGCFIIDKKKDKYVINYNYFREYLKEIIKNEKTYASDAHATRKFKNYFYLLDVFSCNNNSSKLFDKMNKFYDTLEIYKKTLDKGKFLEKNIKFTEILEKYYDTTNLNTIEKHLEKSKCGIQFEKKEIEISDRLIKKISKQLIYEKMTPVLVDIEIFKIRNLLKDYKKSLGNEEELGEIEFNKCHIITKEINITKYNKMFFLKEDMDNVVFNYLEIFQMIFDVYYNISDIDSDFTQKNYYKYTKSPLLISIYEYLDKMNVNEMVKKINKKIEEGKIRTSFLSRFEHYLFITPMNKIIKKESWKKILSNSKIFPNLDLLVDKIIKKGNTNIECANTIYFNRCHIIGMFIDLYEFKKYMRLFRTRVR
jgi:5'-3' exonuclease